MKGSLIIVSFFVLGIIVGLQQSRLNRRLTLKPGKEARHERQFDYRKLLCSGYHRRLV